MKFLNLFFFFIILIGCSFDNKSGIWKNENITEKRDQKAFKEFKNLLSANQSFNEIIKLKNNTGFRISKKIKNLEWKDKFYNNSNYYDNFSYNDLNKLIFNSKKISRHKLNETLLFYNNNAIVSDKKGNMIIFSIETNQVIDKFNFYKKEFKNIEKKLNFIINDTTIFITDNIGFVYAYNFKERKILWAKNFKIPFRSNIKIFKNKIITSNQNNDLYFIDIKNGDLLRLIPTEETSVKNNFINNLSLSRSNTYFLNTFGSLYAFDNESMKIRWFLNLKSSVDLNSRDIFSSTQIINNGNHLIVSSNQFIYILNPDNGRIIFKKNIVSKINPVVNKNYIFLVSETNLLIALDINQKKIIYSYDINEKIAKFLNTKKKNVYYKDIMLVNDKIFIFLKNSYYLIFNVYGEIENVRKLPTKIYSVPIFINNSILYLNNKNKISVID